MDKEYFGQETFFEGKAPLPEWAGYLIVIGFGAFFSLFTWAIMALDRKYVGTKLTSEFFNTAGRDVKMGLTASVIVSLFHTNLCEYYNPETSKQHKLHTAAAAAEPAKAAEPVS